MTNLPSQTLPDANLVAALLRIHPRGLGGVWVRGRHGPQVDRITRILTPLHDPAVKITRSMDALALFGGLDLNETLLAKDPVYRRGLLDGHKTAWLIGAQSMEAAQVARIARATEDKSLLVLLDEGTEDDPLPHETLRDRCAFYLDEGSTADPAIDPLPAPRGSVRIDLTDEALQTLAVTALKSGIPGVRPLMFAVETVRALTALDGVKAPTDDHFVTAVRLVFGHRAILLDTAPDDTPETPDNEPPANTEPNSETQADQELTLPHEMMIEAVATALPGDILARLVERSRTATGAGKGAIRLSQHRGRPLPSRPGNLGGKARPDILATLQAAAPWQRLRGAAPGQPMIRPDDIRVRRYKDRSERLIVFVVDASGSAALARLAEGKGAVEHLLSKAYAERDLVSMIVFRDMGADIVLPPTRALVRAKNALSGLPAGGATPLADGLKMALETALQARRKGQTPQLVLISDGRANRALDGTGDRVTANAEADQIARQLRVHGIPVTLLDTGRRPSRELAALSDTLGSAVVQLPRRMDGRSGDAIAAMIDTQG